MTEGYEHHGAFADDSAADADDAHLENEMHLAAAEFYGRLDVDMEPSIERKAFRKVLTWFQQMFIIIRSHDGNELMAWHAALAALGQFDLLGVKNVAAVAKRYNVPRETVNKIVLAIQEQLKIDPMPGQRSIEGRRNMRKARREQLKK